MTNLMIADLRAVNQDANYSKISQVLDRLSKNWDQRESKFSTLVHLLKLSVFACSFAPIHRGDCPAFQCERYAQGVESRSGHRCHAFHETRHDQKIGECAEHPLYWWSIWQDHSLPKVKSGRPQQQEALLRPRQQVSENFISKRKIS